MNKKPNVIWILGDQHRGQALSCRGDANVSTPNIDNLSVYGVNFTGAVSGYPLCCPFRGSMLTGKYPHKCVPGHEFRLDSDQKTIADVFKENGYHTSYVGKWHLDGFKESEGRAALHVVPPNRRGGFDYWMGYENNNSQWDCYVHGNADGEIAPYKLEGYETDTLTDLFIDSISKKHDKPFFAVLSVQPPHNPYSAPEEFMKQHNPAEIKFRPNVPDVGYVKEKAGRELAGMYAMIENLDYNIGRVRNALKEFGIDGNTHIIYFSDHGDMHGSHGQFLKTSPYEEAIRVPFVIGGEKLCYNGRKVGRHNVLINHVDIAPTTLGLCGIDKPDFMQGTDYSGYRLAGRVLENLPDSAFIQSVIATKHPHSVDREWRGVVTNDGYKYVCFENMDWLLFDLNNDPYEQVNLAHNSVYKNLRSRLRSRLKKWIDDTDDKFTVPMND